MSRDGEEEVWCWLGWWVSGWGGLRLPVPFPFLVPFFLIGRFPGLVFLLRRFSWSALLLLYARGIWGGGMDPFWLCTECPSFIPSLSPSQTIPLLQT